MSAINDAYRIPDDHWYPKLLRTITGLVGCGCGGAVLVYVPLSVWVVIKLVNEVTG